MKEEDFEEEIMEIDLKEMERQQLLFDDETKKIIAEFHSNPTEENLLKAAEAMAGVKRLD